MSFFSIAALLTIASLIIILAIRTSLKQRKTARRLRAVFIREANDLIAKPDFPEDYAKMLIGMSETRSGWVTRLMVFKFFKDIFSNHENIVSSASGEKNINDIPKPLQGKFVVAILAFALSDSYHSLVFGRIFRASNIWLADAVNEPKSDVNAHATYNVIQGVARTGQSYLNGMAAA